MKYILYRSYGNIENEDRKHELVAVEYGKDIYEATDSLIRAVSDDLSEMSEYVGCKTTAFAPEMIQSFFKVKKYKYVIVGQVIPPNAKENILIEYGIIEESE